MSVEFYRESPGKFDSRTLNRKTLNRWTGRTGLNDPTLPRLPPTLLPFQKQSITIIIIITIAIMIILTKVLIIILIILIILIMLIIRIAGGGAPSLLCGFACAPDGMASAADYVSINHVCIYVYMHIYVYVYIHVYI